MNIRPKSQKPRRSTVAQFIIACLAGAMASALLFTLDAFAEARPPTSIASIACRVDDKPHDASGTASDWRDLEWHQPLQCMRLVEPLSDSTQ